MRKTLKVVTSIMLASTMIAPGIQTKAANPLLPLDEYIPDVEARVFTNSEGEERLYLYGSHDEYGSGTWCSHQYRVYSAPLTDLENWTDHGVSFASRKGEGYTWNGKDSDGIAWTDRELYAPDVIKIGDTYYLVTCNAGGTCLGMATSKNPEGPFSPAKKILYDDGSETSNIDPALYVEGEGENQKVYLLWGQTTWFGGQGLLGAELTKDEEGLYTIVKKDTEKVLFGRGGDEFGFYEGASIRKIKDKYYILYPSNKGKGVHMMSYAIADSPLGDYKFGGNILDNDGCDLESGNNHGSFCEINGQWYLFYHRGFGNSNMQRKVCVEKIFFDEEGHITDENGNMVTMTNHGFGGPLSPYENIEAAYATHVRLEGFTSGCYLTEKNKNLHPLVNIKNGNCVEYKDFDFGEEEKDLYFTANVLAQSGGSIDIILDDPYNEPIGTLTVNPVADAEYRELYTPVSDVTGVHTVYFKFNSTHQENICELASFRFTEMENSFREKFDKNLEKWENTENAVINNGVLNLRNNIQMNTVSNYVWDNFSLQLNVKREINDAGIVFRKKDNQNYYLLSIRENELQLKKVLNGNVIIVGTIIESTPSNEMHTYKVDCINEQIIIYKDGVYKGMFKDYAIESGRIGFYQSAGNEASFDDIFVYDKLTRMDRIEINGYPLTEFSNNKKEYSIYLNESSDMPLIHAYSTDNEVNVQVEKPESIPGTARIRFDDEEYKIHFTTVKDVNLKQDLFDQDSYGDFWQILNKNESNIHYEKGVGLKIKSETGDIGNASNPAKNMFLQEADGDWTIETALSANPAFSQIGGNWPSAGLVAYVDEQHFVKLVYLPGGVELNTASGEKQQIGIHLSDPKQTLYLKLEKKGNVYRAFYSITNQNEYKEFANTRTLNSTNVKAGLLTTGFLYPAQTEVTYKMFKVSSQETWPEIKDKEAPEVTVNYSNQTYTNENVKVTLTTNEQVQDIKGWTQLSETEFEKVYTHNMDETLDVIDYDGNETEVFVSVQNIDKKAPIINGVIDEGVYNHFVTYSVEEENIASIVIDHQEYSIQEAPKVISEQGTHTITVVDLAGNETTVTFTIIQKQDKYTVKVNDKVIKIGKYNDKVTVSAPIEEGKTFKAWLWNNEVISTSETFTFYLSQDMDLIPCYEEINVKEQAFLTNIFLTKREDGKADIKFVGQIVIPEGYTLENAGLVWSSKDDTVLDLDNAKATYITRISNTNQFSVTIKGMPEGKCIRGKIFATLKDKEGNHVVIYSEESSKICN